MRPLGDSASDVYFCQGIAAGSRTADNIEGLRKTVEWLRGRESGFCFTNLDDFDSNTDIEGTPMAMHRRS